MASQQKDSSIVQTNSQESLVKKSQLTMPASLPALDEFIEKQ